MISQDNDIDLFKTIHLSLLLVELLIFERIITCTKKMFIIFYVLSILKKICDNLRVTSYKLKPFSLSNSGIRVSLQVMLYFKS